MPGVLVGCLAAGRIGHWLQFLVTVLGRSPARPSLVVGPVQRGPLLLATVAHPVPWLVLIGIGGGIHRLFGPPNKRRVDMVFLRILFWPFNSYGITSNENRPVASKANAGIGPTLIMRFDVRSNNRLERLCIFGEVGR
jgi:hypothetical protein